MRFAWLVVSASLLRVCGNREAPRPVGAAPASAAPRSAMVPEHGGTLTVSGGLATEVLAEPSGRLVVYLRDAQGAPVEAQQVEVALRQSGGQLVAVPVTYDPALHAYVGRPVGVTPGQYPVQVTVHPAPDVAPVELLTPRVDVRVAARAPEPRHGGRVEVVGDHAVEVVTAPSGEVTLYWTDLEGHPIPTADVQVPSVDLTVNGRVETVAVRPVDDHFVGHSSVIAPSATVMVAVPGGVILGRRFHRVHFAHPVVVATGPAVVVEHPTPAVVVERPSPVVVVERPPPVVVVPAHGHGHGWGHGHWRGGGGVIVVPGAHPGWRGRGHWR